MVLPRKLVLADQNQSFLQQTIQFDLVTIVGAELLPLVTITSNGYCLVYLQNKWSRVLLLCVFKSRGTASVLSRYAILFDAHSVNQTFDSIWRYCDINYSCKRPSGNIELCHKSSFGRNLGYFISSMLGKVNVSEFI